MARATSGLPDLPILPPVWAALAAASGSPEPLAFTRSKKRRRFAALCRGGYTAHSPEDDERLAARDDLVVGGQQAAGARGPARARGQHVAAHRAAQHLPQLGGVLGRLRAGGRAGPARDQDKRVRCAERRCRRCVTTLACCCAAQPPACRSREAPSAHPVGAVLPVARQAQQHHLGRVLVQPAVQLHTHALARTPRRRITGARATVAGRLPGKVRRAITRCA